MHEGEDDFSFRVWSLELDSTKQSENWLEISHRDMMWAEIQTKINFGKIYYNSSAGKCVGLGFDGQVDFGFLICIFAFQHVVGEGGWGCVGVFE